MKYVKIAIKFIVLLPLIPFLAIYMLKLGLEVSFQIETNGKKFSYEKAQEDVMSKFAASVMHKKAFAYSASLILWAVIAYFILG